MGELVFSYKYMYNGTERLMEYRLDDGAEILRSITTPITCQIGPTGNKETKYLYRSGCYIDTSGFILYFAADQNTYIREYLNGNATGNWSRLTTTNNDGAYTYVGQIQKNGSYYPQSDNRTWSASVQGTDLYINEKIARTNSYDDYLIYITSQAPTYNWQSVSSITGRMGNLPLAQVKSQYINGGSPVSAATLNYFTNLPVDSNVGNLVIDTSIDSAEVLVKYRIPEGTYGYINLVYKENSEPANLYDGVVNVIRQNESQIVLDSITTSGTYYFKIFTDKGNSNTVVLNYVGIIPIIFSIEREW